MRRTAFEKNSRTLNATCRPPGNPELNTALPGMWLPHPLSPETSMQLSQREVAKPSQTMAKFPVPFVFT